MVNRFYLKKATQTVAFKDKKEELTSYRLYLIDLIIDLCLLLLFLSSSF
jgi:hypothetical protein